MGGEQELEDEVTKLKARIVELEERVKACRITHLAATHSASNIILLDRDARVQYINHTVPGVTPEEIVGLSIYDLLDGAFSGNVSAALKRVIDSGKPDRYQTSYTSPLGEVSWWESTVGPVFEGSEVTGFVVVSTDVTQQRNNAEEHERFFELSVHMMCVVGFDGHFKRLNPAFHTTLGFGQELLERPYIEFVHPDDVKATEEVVSRMAGGETILNFTCRFRTIEGSYRLLSWKGIADSKRVVMYAVASDITEARNLEEQLQQSRKLEAVGKLAGGVAHDFNNLLLAIQGNIEFAAESPEHAPASLKDAMDACHRAASLTKQLLTFSRHQNLSPKVLDWGVLLDDVMSLLRRLLPENISIVVRHSEEVPPIFADQTQIEQLVVNLCLNARDSMPKGGSLELVLSEVELAESSLGELPASPGKYVLLVVTDNGSGMSTSVQDRIFEPFFTTKAVGKGTGLGLATVYGIVQQHKGFVEVESEVGKGTSFRVYLPVTTRSKPSSKPALIPTRPPQGGKETILIAEDEDMVRKVVARMLTQAGYAVLEAQDGQEALRLFHRNAERIALVLLDVVMPGLGGLDTAAKLREQRADLKVIFASGHIRKDEDEKLLEGEAVLLKPYQGEDLLRAVRSMLEGGKPGDAEDAPLAEDPPKMNSLKGL